MWHVFSAVVLKPMQEVFLNVYFYYRAHKHKNTIDFQVGVYVGRESGFSRTILRSDRFYVQVGV